MMPPERLAVHVEGHVKYEDGQCLVDCPHPSHLADLCTCGHTRSEHFRDRGNCMAETDAETWACDCPEYEGPT